MTAGRAEAALDWLEAARGRCDLQALESLWAAVPEPMRLTRFAASGVPPQYAGAFCHDGTWQAGVDLSSLPGCSVVHRDACAKGRASIDRSWTLTSQKAE